MNNILLTGAAGFIGFHIAKELIQNGHHVIGVDNINDYYDPMLKKARLSELKNHKNSNKFIFQNVDISDLKSIEGIFKTKDFDYVIHMAAQAGVRYSLENPHTYIESNILGFLNIIEGCKNHNIQHLVYASSSSVYGMNNNIPFDTSDKTDSPISLYAATKKSNELMAHTYSHLFNIPMTGLRFFTVYGPYGRPDMAYFKFTKSILESQPIKVFNKGQMERDFTWIDDIVNAVISLLDIPPSKEKSIGSSAFSMHKIYNLGNNNPVKLNKFINVLEDACKVKAKKIYLPMQPGDVITTYAKIDEAQKVFNFNPSTNIEEGLKKFVQWYKDFYKK